MKTPAHPGLLVKDNLDDLGLFVANAAAGLGVTRQQLHRVIGGQSAITPDMALRLEAALGKRKGKGDSPSPQSHGQSRLRLA